MMPNDIRLDILKLIIADEHHYRSMFQSRIAYHTTIILAVTGSTMALSSSIKPNPLNYFILSIGGLLIFFIARHAISAVERIYLHFIEAINARGQIEHFLGIRDLNKKRTTKRQIGPLDIKREIGNENKLWPYTSLFEDSWTPGEGKGYYTKTKDLFFYFEYIGLSIFFFLLIRAAVNLDF